MSKKRILSETEKAQIKASRRAAEQVLHPGTRFAVQVKDETDDNGEPIVRVTRLG